MHEQLTLTVNGAEVVVPSGASVAVAVLLARGWCRKSVTGEMRGAVCGMGVCLECRVTINGTRHSRSCQVPCEAGMDVRSDE